MRQGMDVWRVTGAEALRPYYLGPVGRGHGEGGQRGRLTLLAEALAVANDTGSAAGKPSCIGLKASSRWRT